MLHITPELVAGASFHEVGRIETLGPITRAHLAELFGTNRITLTLAVDTGADRAGDALDVPGRMREQVVLREAVEPFPYSSGSARGLERHAL